MTPGLLTEVATAVLLGFGLGAGACLLLSLVPRWGALSLARRIGPYIRDVGDPRGVTPWVASAGGWSSTAQEAWASARRRWATALGGSEPIARRLAQAGSSMEVTGYRGRQLVCAIAGLASGAVLVVVLALVGRAGPALVVLPPVLAAVGIVLCDAHLARAARVRVGRIQEELPTVLEFLALCLTAGEGLLDSIRRVAAVGAGEMTAEIRSVVITVETGSPLADSLRSLAARLQLPALSRSIDHVVAAIERGAPLAVVLQSQAGDAREDATRTLIEQAGRKEIAMLVPRKIG